VSTTAVMRQCPHCGRMQPLDVDFCVCGEYLAWSDVTAPVASGAGPADPAGAAPSSTKRETSDVMLSVATTGMAPDDERIKLTVGAGSRVELTAAIRNLGSVVDTFTLVVDGIPADWVQIHGNAVDLLPKGPEGNYERTVNITIQPPRDSSATAGDHALTVGIESAAHGREGIEVPVSLTILPFYSLVLFAPRPQTLVARHRGRLRCSVRNNGNVGVMPRLTVTDETGACSIVTPDIAVMAPAQTREVDVRVSARRPLLGHRVDHHLTVTASAPGMPEPTPPQPVIFRQRPLIPWWVPVALAMLAALAIALIALLITRPHKVTTPALVGAPSAFDAQRALQRAGFTAAPLVQTTVLPGTASGTVLDQAPAAGTKVAPNTVVTLRVAVPPASTIIPNLTHLTVAAAENRLYEDHLALGSVLPALNTTLPIVNQIPTPGNVRPRGTAVNLILAAPGNVTVPNVYCLSVQHAEERLSAYGFKLGTLPNFASATSNIQTQLPAAGQKRPPGTVVRVTVYGSPSPCQAAAHPKTAGAVPAAAGTASSRSRSITTAARASPPGLVYDAGGAVKGLKGPAITGRNPSFSPSGRYLAVAATGEVVVRDLSRSMSPVLAVHAPGGAAGPLAFAPTVGSGTLAFVDVRVGAPDELCLVDVRVRPARPDCRALPGASPNALGWMSGGHTLLIVIGAPGRGAILAARTAAASSSRWSTYTLAAKIVPRASGVDAGVLAATGAPGSGQVALIVSVTALGQPSPPQIVLLNERGLANLAGARWLGVAACALAFDPTGTRLAAVSPSGAACQSVATPGTLFTASLRTPSNRQIVSLAASSPAWR
jgi:beta-lactam-binding protein with PASTA domain